MKKMATWGKNGYVNSDQKEKKQNKTVQTLRVLHIKEALEQLPNTLCLNLSDQRKE